MPQANGLQFTARVGELPSDMFSVVSFALTEGLSQLFHGRLIMASTDPGIQASDVLEQPVDLMVWQDGTPLRRFIGVVNEFSRGDTGYRRTRYELSIQPPLWRLGLMHNSRIFQTQTTDTIVRTLLEERGIVDSVFDLKRAPQAREYCVQHRESDLAFIERLAAEEGWHYRYQHGSVDGNEQPGLILADHHGDAPRLEAAEYNGKAGGSTQQPAVFRFRYEERVRAAVVAMKDYTFKPVSGLSTLRLPWPIQSRRQRPAVYRSSIRRPQKRRQHRQRRKQPPGFHLRCESGTHPPRQRQAKPRLAVNYHHPRGRSAPGTRRRRRNRANHLSQPVQRCSS